MNKIVPALLHNMNKCAIPQDDICAVDAPVPSQQLATQVVQELTGRATTHTAVAVIQPTLQFLDDMEAWGTPFAAECFRVIMFSVQPQFVHLPVELLLHHLSATTDVGVKTGMIQVLSAIVSIAADGAIGPAVLDVVHTLLRQLRLTDEGGIQAAVLGTFRAFVPQLRDFQCTDVMTIILGIIGEERTGDGSKCKLLECLLTVAEARPKGDLGETLPEHLLTRVLNIALDESVKVRILVQQVLRELLQKPEGPQTGTFFQGRAKLLWALLEIARMPLDSEWCILALLVQNLVALGGGRWGRPWWRIACVWDLPYRVRARTGTLRA